jgi:uncharacterized membrane protein YgcG
MLGKSALGLGLAALALGLAACEEPGAGEARGAIIGGEDDPGDPAVVMLASYPPDHTTLDTCTASVIAPNVLLTAAHCVDPNKHPSYLYGVFTGADASAYTTANTLIPHLASVKEVHMHPDYVATAPFHADVGVVITDQPIGVDPLPIQRDPLDKSVVGQPARIVGYGQIKYQDYNAVRHQAATTVATLDSGDTITVGDLDHRSCVGDSGGPALVKVGGEERIVGVDSYTDLAGCLDPAHYRRPDLYTAFLDTYAPPPAQGTGGSGGSGGGESSGGAGAGGSSPKGGGCHVAAPGAGDREAGGAAWALLFGALVSIAGAGSRRRVGRGPGRRWV